MTDADKSGGLLSKSARAKIFCDRFGRVEGGRRMRDRTPGYDYPDRDPGRPYAQNQIGGTGVEASTTKIEIAVELSDFALILNRALEVAQDLEAAVNAEYPDDSPTSVRRRKRDSETARWLQSAIPAFRVKYRVREADE